MKNNEEQIDKIILEALSKEEAGYYDKLGEQSILDMSLGVLRGKNKGIYLLTIIFSFLLFGVFVYSAIKFFKAQDIIEMLRYGAIGFFSILSITAIKIWYWMQMNTNALQREMKRIEIQLAALLNEKHKE
jgi:hypothetical protein